MNRKVRNEPPRTHLAVGPIRIDSSHAALARRLSAGDVAVIDALDLDARSAAALASKSPAAVLNVRSSISGRYPAGGAAVLADAGIPLIDGLDPEILGLRDGTTASITVQDEDPQGKKADQRRATVEVGPHDFTGHLMDADAIGAALESARAGTKVQLAAFSASALDVVDQAGAALLEGEGLPVTEVDMSGRHVVVVAPGAHVENVLRKLRPYARDRKPIIIAIGDAADVALGQKFRPDIVIGTPDELSEPVLAAARSVVIHGAAASSKSAVRAERAKGARTSSSIALASEDLAVLMAHHGGAQVIVIVGGDVSLHDFLDSAATRSTAHAAGTLLTRLVASGKVVDGRSIPLLYRPTWTTLALIAAALLAVVALAAAVWINTDSRALVQDLFASVGVAG